MSLLKEKKKGKREWLMIRLWVSLNNKHSWVRSGLIHF
jgi:hypothetical protein